MTQHEAETPNLAKQTPIQRTLRRCGRAAVRGVTLVEVLIVVAIMALIAGGVSFMILPKYRDTQKKTAKTTARNIRQIAIQYMAIDGTTEGCPTVESLIAAKQLDAAGDTKDPWGEPYKISCSADDVTVSSTGPDKKQSEDDIIVGPGGESAD